MQKEKIKILIACEESQEVTKAFRRRGFNAYSCDLQECSGGRPEWHIKGDVLNIINDGWDFMLGHPTCTYLTNSGVCWLYNKDGTKNLKRWEKLQQSAIFFKSLLNAKITYIAIENPIAHKYAIELIGEKYSQIIQPWQFGHTETKATCLWLKGLPKLEETKNMKEILKTLPKKEVQRLHYLSPGPERAKLRSKTFTGIAEAIADQWGEFLLQNLK